MKKLLTILLLCSIVICPTLAQNTAKGAGKNNAKAQTFTHPWSGKRVAYFGDSITDPGTRGSDTKFWGYLQEWLQITPLVYGVGGRQWNDIPRQSNKLREEHGDNFDAILIFMGTNDYNAGLPIGEWFEEKYERVEYAAGYDKRMEDRKRRYPIMSNSTYRGRINIALDSLKRMFPTKQIVLLTPIHRAYFQAGNRNVQCTEDYTNRCGEYLEAYVESIKEGGQYWAVPVIDLGAVSGLYPMHEEHKQYFVNKDTDALHPNDAGHERMARTLMYQLLTLPCTF